MKNIAITGAGGRMGKALIEAITSTHGIQLTVAIEYSGSPLIGADAGEIAGLGRNDIAVAGSLDELADSFDTLIDFSVPAATVRNAEFCRRHGKKMVVGTTGLSTDQVQAVQQASEYTSICMASNYATGVNLCFKLAELAASVLGNDVDIEISEAHHRNKVDAPSGTALSLGEAVAGALGRDLNEVAVYDRQGLTGERGSESIGFSVVRAGDIVGDHTVLFASEGERIEITHKASSRMAFALGAIRASKWINKQSVGLFDMQDVLGLK